jgi:sarcosine oxidase subunit gamma
MSKASFTVLRSDAQGVSLVFRRSFADYIWRLIERTARPYGLQVTQARDNTDSVLSPLLNDAGAETLRGQALPA